MNRELEDYLDRVFHDAMTVSGLANLAISIDVESSHLDIGPLLQAIRTISISVDERLDIVAMRKAGVA